MLFKRSKILYDVRLFKKLLTYHMLSGKTLISGLELSYILYRLKVKDIPTEPDLISLDNAPTNKDIIKMVRGDYRYYYIPEIIKILGSYQYSIIEGYEIKKLLCDIGFTDLKTKSMHRDNWDYMAYWNKTVIKASIDLDIYRARDNGLLLPKMHGETSLYVSQDMINAERAIV